MSWKRLTECPACGKDRCVLVPTKRNMLFCYRMNTAYWIKKDGSLQILPKYRSIIEDNLGKEISTPLFPEDATNYLFDPKNPYYVPQENLKEKNAMESSKLQNTNPVWTRSFCYRLIEYFWENLTFKNGKLQKVGLNFTSKEYQSSGYLSHFEIVIELENKQSCIVRFSFKLGAHIGNLVLDEQLILNKEILKYLENRLNMLIGRLIEKQKTELVPNLINETEEKVKV